MNGSKIVGFFLWFKKKHYRDVKNLLKLSCLISSSRNIPISSRVVKFVRQFKPTQSTNGISDNIEGVELEGISKPLRPKFSRGEIKNDVILGYKP